LFTHKQIYIHRSQTNVRFIDAKVLVYFKYKIELNDFLKKYNDKIKKKGGEEIVDKYITKFNEIICEYDSMFSIFENKYGITKSCKELMM